MPLPKQEDQAKLTPVRRNCCITVRLFPCGNTFLRSMRIDCPVLAWNCPTQIFQQDVSNLTCQLFDVLALCLKTESPCLCQNLLLAFYVNRSLALRRIFQRQHACSSSCTMAGCPCRQMAQEIACTNQISISTTYSTRCFLGDATRSHEAVLTTYACYTRITLWLLCIRTVKQ